MSEVLASILDNAAAVGDVDTLNRMAYRWECRARYFDPHKIGAQISLYARAVKDAAGYRARAIGARLDGNVSDAVNDERYSEREIAWLNSHAR